MAFLQKNQNKRKGVINIMESAEVVRAISATDSAGGADYALRKCSFEPKAHLINLENDPSKKPRLYLTVEWRVYWFQTWCQENGKRYLIEERPVDMVPGTNFIQSCCTVYIDGEAAGFGIGGINLSGSKGGDYCVQSCATIAKGRALANAGFGSVFSSALDSENGADIPCDGGMGTDFFVFSPQWLNPADNSQASDQTQPAMKVTQSTEPAKDPGKRLRSLYEPSFSENKVKKVTTVPATANAPTTREEALKFIVPMKGEWFGHPLGDVLAKSPKDVQFYASCRNADLKAAANLVLNR